MYIRLDPCDGQYCIRETSETRPPDYGRNPNWICVQPQVLRAWEATQDQLAVFDQLFTALSNERYEEVKQR